MSSLLETTLDCAQRGWAVFPCEPKKKKAQLNGGFHLATTDETQIRDWWTRFPNANIGLAPGKSGLVILDCDTGFANQAEFEAWAASVGLPKTYTIHTGRRTNNETGLPEFGAQLYFAGSGLPTYPWRLDGHSGEVRYGTGHVMAVGSVHPDSGELYEVLVDAPIVEVPAFVLNLPRQTRPVNTDGTRGKIPELGGRHDALTREAGAMRARGHDRDTILEMLIPLNDAMCEVPISDGDLEHIADSVARYKAGVVGPEIIFGKKKPDELQEPVDWRTRYMTAEQYANIPPPSYLIGGFLVKGSITMIAGRVSQRKSIVSMNLCHALTTGEKLFGYFPVVEKPERVIYICPEMGPAQVKKRLEQIGLGPYIGKSLFVQVMSKKPTTMDEFDDELPGAVVFLDTITRFVDGDEDKSGDMRIFAAKCFHLVDAGATVVLVHHSKKGSTGSLDDGLRGSSELAAFVDSVWTTELVDTKDAFHTLSNVQNVKQRDFESLPFQLSPSPGTIYLTMVDEPAAVFVQKAKKDARAFDILKGIVEANPTMGVNKLAGELRKAMKGRGGKGAKWIQEQLSIMRRDRDGGSGGCRVNLT
jgi:hypothetical protein